MTISSAGGVTTSSAAGEGVAVGSPDGGWNAAFGGGSSWASLGSRIKPSPEGSSAAERNAVAESARHSPIAAQVGRGLAVGWRMNRRYGLADLFRTVPQVAPRSKVKQRRASSER